MPTGQLFIGGAWRPSVSGETYQTINPATEEPSATVARGDERDIDLAVAAARKAFDGGPWPRMTAAERGRIVWKLGDLITQNLDEMARLESLCTGKTLFDSGKVEIPRWRYAIVNFPHPLLESGLTILDTPGYNTMGSEPELTIHRLPDAAAVVFMLGS